MLADRNAMAMIAVRNLGRAREFYEGTLGLKRASPDNPEMQVYASGDSRIVVYVSQYAGTNKATSVTWEVGDVERTVQELKSRRVTFEHYDMPDTIRQGDVHIAGKMRVAWFKDPDGNILSIVDEGK